MGRHVLEDHDSALAQANAELRHEGVANQGMLSNRRRRHAMECRGGGGHRWERLKEYQEGGFLMERVRCKVCFKQHDFLWQRHPDGKWHACYE